MQVDRMLRERGGLAEPVAGMPARTRTGADTCFGNSSGTPPGELSSTGVCAKPAVRPLRGLHEPVSPSDAGSDRRVVDNAYFRRYVFCSYSVIGWGSMGRNGPAPLSPSPTPPQAAKSG